MGQIKLEFIRERKSYPNFNIDKPNTIYNLKSSNELQFRIEFIHSVNAKIIENDKTYYCGPPAKKVSFGKINIIDNEKNKIGNINFWGWTFKKKKITLQSERGEIFWTINNRNYNEVELINNEIVLTLIKEKSNTVWKNILNDQQKDNFSITFSERIKEEKLMCGLAIYVYELIEFNRKNTVD